jgi:hypothetical protein
VQVTAGLYVHVEDVAAGVSEAGQVILRPLDHEVHVQRDIHRFAYSGDNQRPKCDHRHEVPIHDVQVDVVGARGNRFPHLVANASEVRGED